MDRDQQLFKGRGKKSVSHSSLLHLLSQPLVILSPFATLSFLEGNYISSVLTPSSFSATSVSFVGMLMCWGQRSTHC